MEEKGKRRALRQRVPVRVFLDERRECRVDVREARVRPGDTVVFSTEVGPLEVFVPTPADAKDLFPRALKPVFTVPNGGKELTVSATAPSAPVAYPYTVYCRKYGAFASASFPKFILG